MVCQFIPVSCAEMSGAVSSKTAVAANARGSLIPTVYRVAARQCDRMSGMNRREFLATSLAVLAAPRVSSAASCRIEILPEEAIGTISPNLFGHFTEHLGGCIYDGIWVGENSKIPNTGGIRQSVIDNLRRIKAPVVRWPGGCFADSYNWRDGVGP